MSCLSALLKIGLNLLFSTYQGTFQLERKNYKYVRMCVLHICVLTTVFRAEEQTVVCCL